MASPAAWFRNSDGTVSNQQGLKTIQSASNDFERFVDGFEPRRARERFALDRLASDEDSLQDQLQSLALQAAQGHAAADAQKGQYDRDRLRGHKHAGRLSQNFVKAFSGFVQAYSGIVSLIKDAAAPYGSAGFEALSVILIVVDNKAANDLGLTFILESISKALPRLDTLRTIYPTAALETNIANVYECVIKLSQEIATYFAHFWRRVSWAFIRPATTGVMAETSRLKTLLAEVNRDVMIELQKRVLEIREQGVQTHQQIAVTHAQNNELQQKVTRLEYQNAVLEKELLKVNGQLEDFAAQSDQEHLDDMWNKLACEGHHCRWPETSMQNAVESLAKDFPESSLLDHVPGQQPPINKHFRSMTRVMLSKEKYYQCWLQAEHSSLLILSGVTYPDGRQRGQISATSWLSPASVFAAQACGLGKHGPGSNETSTTDVLHTDGLAIYFNCQPHFQEITPPGRNLWRLLAYLIWHTYAWTRVERSRTADIRQRAGAIAAWFVLDPHDALLQAVNLLLEMLSHASTGSGTVRVVIDRLDRCAIESTTKGGMSVHVYHILRQLSRLCDHSAARVKLFIVLNSQYQGSPWGPGNAGWDTERFFYKSWDQQTRGPYD